MGIQWGAEVKKNYVKKERLNLSRKTGNWEETQLKMGKKIKALL